MCSLLALLCLAVSADPAVSTVRSPADLTGPWQLFVDDAGIAEKVNASRVYHAFEKAPSNPVLVPEKPWEGSTVYVYGTVLPAADGAGYRMWYHSWAGGEYRNLYATSPDGLRWTKPELGLVSYEGSTQNNILFRRTKEDPTFPLSQRRNVTTVPTRGLQVGAKPYNGPPRGFGPNNGQLRTQSERRSSYE